MDTFFVYRDHLFQTSSVILRAFPKNIEYVILVCLVMNILDLSYDMVLGKYHKHISNFERY